MYQFGFIVSITKSSGQFSSKSGYCLQDFHFFSSRILKLNIRSDVFCCFLKLIFHYLYVDTQPPPPRSLEAPPYPRLSWFEQTSVEVSAFLAQWIFFFKFISLLISL